MGFDPSFHRNGETWQAQHQQQALPVNPHQNVAYALPPSTLATHASHVSPDVKSLDQQSILQYTNQLQGEHFNKASSKTILAEPSTTAEGVELLPEPHPADFDSFLAGKAIKVHGPKTLETVSSPLRSSPTKAEALAIYDATNQIVTNQMMAALPLVNSTSVISSAEPGISPFQRASKASAHEQFTGVPEPDFSSHALHTGALTKQHGNFTWDQHAMQQTPTIVSILENSQVVGHESIESGAGLETRSGKNVTALKRTTRLPQGARKQKVSKSISKQTPKPTGRSRAKKQNTNMIAVPPSNITEPNMQIETAAGQSALVPGGLQYGSPNLNIHTSLAIQTPSPPHSTDILHPVVASSSTETATKVPTGDDALTKLLKVSKNGVRKPSQKSKRKAKKAARCDPSRFCHICTRSVNSVEVAYCSNIAKGECRKIICIKCADNFGLDDVRAAIYDPVVALSWECQHCRKCCPDKAQCGTYGRINLLRREKGRMRKEAKMAALAATQNFAALSATRSLTGLGGPPEPSDTLDDVYERYQAAAASAATAAVNAVADGIGNVPQDLRNQLVKQIVKDLKKTQVRDIANAQATLVPPPTFAPPTFGPDGTRELNEILAEMAAKGGPRVIVRTPRVANATNSNISFSTNNNAAGAETDRNSSENGQK